MRGTFFIVTTLVLAHVGAFGRTISVDLNGGGDYTDIQSAIDAAADGDTVSVKAGEYSIAGPLNFNRLRTGEGPRPPLKNIVVISEKGPEKTTIRMSDNPTDAARRSVVIFENGETERSRLEGFTITGGSGTGGESVGGGVVCSASSPILVNLRIMGNSALYGGGLYCLESSPTLVDSTIEANFAGRSGEQGGGGAYLAKHSSPRLSRCTIRGNFGRFGAGVLCRENSSPTLTNTTIIGNSSLGGAGLHCTVNSSPILTNCRLTGNSALGVGALFCDEDSSPILTNCTIVGNERGAIECTSLRLTNCIVWANNGLSIRAADPSLPEVTYSCVQGDEVWPGEGNINEDPLIWQSGFWNLNGTPLELFDDFWIDGDDHLRPASPCIDSGTSQDAPGIDLDGNGRPCGDGVDRGAYETGGCPPPPEFRFLRGDGNGDGKLDVADPIANLTFQFVGTFDPPCLDALDFDDSGELDVTDPIANLTHQFLGGPAPAPPGKDACGVDPIDDELSCDSFAACPGDVR